jgi:hypothetical protein
MPADPAPGDRVALEKKGNSAEYRVALSFE